MSKKINSKITGTGSFAPTRILTNYDLEKMVETSDEWIVTRTGIKERRIAEDGTGPSDLSLEASRIALQEADLQPEEIDLILIGTVTPDYLLPSTACILQDRLKAKNAAVLDIVAACSGFIYGLSIASAFIAIGQYKNVLVIGVETLSKIINWEDRNTCVLFGDGAGAAVVSATTEDRGILGTFLSGDGSLADLLHIPMGGAKAPLTRENIGLKRHYISMKGNEVFKSAVRAMENSAKRIIQEVGLSSEEID